jgi:dTDP-4-dehydrorhamnose reductase
VIVVLGANGQLGQAFLRKLGHDCRPVERDELDLANLTAIEPWMRRAAPDLVINCAAYTAVDDAETDVDAARTVNALAVGALAQATARHRSGLVTFSTDYVFDGERQTSYVESDEPNPINVYGETKLQGERLGLTAHPGALVVRTSWLLSSVHGNFLTKILGLLTQGPVTVVDDQFGTPTFVDDLAQATLDAIAVGASGILHLTNQGATTWFQLARGIAEAAGFEPDLVQPQSSLALDRPARRPRNSVLRSERLPTLGLSELPSYTERIHAAVADATNVR